MPQLVTTNIDIQSRPHPVVVPTFLGAMLGMWLDKNHPGSHSWTLALLTVGLVLGCVNAWHWVDKEDKAMRDEEEDDHE